MRVATSGRGGTDEELPPRPDDDIIVVIGNGRGKIVMIITCDGSLYFNPEFSPDKQASAFRQAMNLAVQDCVFATVLPDVVVHPVFPVSEE